MAYWQLVILGKLQLAALILLPLQVPCLLIFGDSLSYNGNNNNLATTAKSNYQPYGIDFPKGQPTGRFTNGRNLLDFNAEELGFHEDSILPYAKATVGSDEKVLKGVNYASGAAGILNESGRTRGDRIPAMDDQQLTNHQKTVSRIINKLGKKNATQLLNKCIYSVAIGRH
ncbi:GDSL esterase/lipase At5g45670-like [Juglans microcarpa x Juglans regia]|uniref:GDSL esterase/lipase At5g45670-like n=1 Tax=Juglans microcarpa x Juglans regia TaxID=2249226 RepID=UPI001B7DF13A|nr:GDSL esterase/lipase At5g45670-like [Juglans microcarpa x Juglans regia]